MAIEHIDGATRFEGKGSSRQPRYRKRDRGKKWGPLLVRDELDELDELTSVFRHLWALMGDNGPQLGRLWGTKGLTDP